MAVQERKAVNITLAASAPASLFSLKKTRKSQTPLSVWYAFVILAAVTLIIYGRSFKYELTYFDDDAILMQNAQRLDSLNVTDAFVLDAEFGHRIDLYRPLANSVSLLISGYGLSSGHVPYHRSAASLPFRFPAVPGFTSFKPK